MIGSLNLDSITDDFNKPKEHIGEERVSNTHPVPESDLEVDFLEEIGDGPFFKHSVDDTTVINPPESIITPEEEFSEEDTVDIIRLKDDSPIEGAPYSRGPNGRYIKPSENKEIEWGTEYVAKLLNTTTQTVRSYADRYANYLGIRKLHYGQRKFTKESIDRLRELLRFKDENGLTLVQLDEYINSGKDPLKYLPEDQKLDKIIEFFEKFQSSMEDNLKAMFNSLNENNRKLIEEKNTSQEEVIASLLETVNKQTNRIEELSSVIEKGSKSKEKELQETISSLQSVLKEKEALVKSLSEDNRLKESQISELQSKQKKGIFGFFK